MSTRLINFGYGGEGHKVRGQGKTWRVRKDGVLIDKFFGSQDEAMSYIDGEVDPNQDVKARMIGGSGK